MEESDNKLRSGDFVKYGGIYSPLLNPGNFSCLHEKPQRILAAFLADGIEVLYERNYGQNRGLSCSWTLSQTAPSGFRLGAFYSHQSENNVLDTPRIQVDVNPNTMASNIDVLYHPIDPLRFKFHYQLQPKCPLGRGSARLEFIAPTSTSTLHVDNITGPVSFLTLSHLHGVTPRWSLAAEVNMRWGSVEGVTLNTAYAVRYSQSASQAAVSFSTQALDFSYWRQIHPAIQVGVLMASNRQKPLIASIFYQWDFNESVVRGMINSQWSVGVTHRRYFITQSI
ncbi:mitochondrial import receptor subunit TOM40 homolog [Sergentomyia squamirostris]